MIFVMWYALYVKSRHEKKVAALLNAKGIESYVPLRKTLKQWSDRKKWVEEPVISCYVFVKILPSQRECVLMTPGVVAYVRSNRRDAVISDREIKIMKDMLGVPSIDLCMERDDLCLGQLCEVVGGALNGMMVNIVEIRGKRKVGVYIADLKLGLTCEMNPAYLRPVREFVDI